MLTPRLTHPDILAAPALAGRRSAVLIAARAMPEVTAILTPVRNHTWRSGRPEDN